MKKYSIIFLLTFFIHSHLSAQNSNYSFRHINSDNGLSQNSVLTIMQDKKGFIWFGTKDGLNRFDGYNLKIFKYEVNNPKSIGNNTIWSLLELNDGKILVGTDKGIYIFDPINEYFTQFNIKTEKNEEISGAVLDMKLDKYGNVWITSVNLYKYSIEKNKLETFLYIDQIPVNKKSFLINAWSINIDSDNQIWISILHGGMKRFDLNTNKLHTYTYDENGNDLRLSQIARTINSGNNHLFIASYNDGLRIMDKTKEKIYKYPISADLPENLFIRDLKILSDGKIWIGTESGLYISDQKSGIVTHLTHNIYDKYSISDNAIYSIYEDREGGVWIGTYFGGINYYPLSNNYFEKFYPISNQNSISGERISGMCEDNDGNIWIGTEDNGLNKLDKKTLQFTNFSPQNSGLSYHNVHDIILDNDFLWIATFSHGINVYNLKTQKWKYYVKGDKDGMLNNNDIFALYKDNEQNIWVGTSNGTFVFDRENEKFIRQQFMKEFFISDIIEDATGKIWLSTFSNGVVCYNPRTKEHINYNHNPKDSTSISHFKISCMFVDSKDRIWFGTESRGLSTFDEKTKKFITFGVKDGFSNDVIYKILEDNAGNLWLSTNMGLIRFNPETKEVRIFTQNNGLPSNQFNYKSGLKDKSGKMYFGSINGMTTFIPANFGYNKSIPPVRITDFSLLNKKHQSLLNNRDNSVVKLKHKQSSFEINFSALSYVAPEMNKYAYKMEGLDDSWNYLNHPQKILYSNLAPGKYTFKVKASNNDGVWNEVGDSMQIIIKPPFWRSIWGYLLYAILLVYGVYRLILYYRNKHEKEAKRKLLNFEKEKEKEIYNAKIEFFTNIAHEIRTPLTLIKGPLEFIINSDIQKDELDANLSIMEKNTDRLLVLINQLLDFRKTESKGFSLNFVHLNISEMLTCTYERFKPIIEQKLLTTSIKLPDKELWADVDSEAFTKIISNLFSNAIKYADNNIEIELSEKASNFIIKVKNDGNLIPDNLNKKIFEAFYQIHQSEDEVKSGSGIGLTLVKSLVGLHGGSVFLDSDEKEKNSFVVMLPLKQENVIELNPNIVINSDTNVSKIDLNSFKKQINILIVEDDKQLLNFISGKLNVNYNVFEAENGLEALKILESEVINLVVSDVVMPKIDGLELCEKIKNSTELSHIPVILLTAKTNTQSKIQGLESGADAYVEKPFSLEYLFARISNILENREKLSNAFANSPFLSSRSIGLSKSDEIFLTKITEVIHENISNENFTVDKLAESIFMSRSSLLRKIKVVYNTTPNDFIRLIRLKKAAELLVEGKFRINEVCYLVGFSSFSYFTKAFQKQFGVLPKDFVKNLRK